MDRLATYSMRLYVQTTSNHRGFTLVELMIGLVLAGTLLGFVFSTFGTLSRAYNRENKISDVQQDVASVRDILRADLINSGFGIPDGARTRVGTTAIGPLIVEDHTSSALATNSPNNIGDRLSLQRIERNEGTPRIVSSFPIGMDYVVLNHDDWTGPESPVYLVFSEVIDADPDYVKTTSCVLGGGQPTLSSGEYRMAVTPGTDIRQLNTTTNSHCDDVVSGHNAATLPDTKLYKAWSTTYELVVDTTLNMPVLKRSINAGPAYALPTVTLPPTNPERDEIVAVGVVDFQVAVRVMDSSTGPYVDRDGDGDTRQDWISGATDFANLNSYSAGGRYMPVRVNVSLVFRTIKQVRGATGSEIPAFSNSAYPNYNELGNRDAIDLTATGLPSYLSPNSLYRWSTISIDIRNIRAPQ